MNTLIVSGHPRISHSLANRIIIEQLIDHPRVIVCDLITNYADGNIDVEAEQNKIVESDLVVLQFPFIWYGMPSHMKAWMEKVFADGFAFGNGGNYLQNKRLLLSVTTGGSSIDYSISGKHLHPVETFLKPIELFVKYCGMEYLPPVYTYEMAGRNEPENTIVKEKAIQHAARVLRTINQVESELKHHLINV